MVFKTISEVSRDFGISTRTLRYYEQIGLIRSMRQPDYAYRVYTREMLVRLQQVLVLRKLRIPLKEIQKILEDGDAAGMLQMLQTQLDGIQDEITSLNVIRDVLKELKYRIEHVPQSQLISSLMDDEVLLQIIDTLSLSKINFKEEKSMADLNQAQEILSKPRDVRIIYIAPCTVASSHFIGPNPEDTAGERLMEFMVQQNLYEQKPDARVFGFNHPSPMPENKDYGYEFWVTIPEELEVKKPLVKKIFHGGLYAAHTIKMGDFHEWEWISRWVDESSIYDANYAPEGQEIMGGCLEEELSAVYYSKFSRPEAQPKMLDLLIPIKEKQ